MAHQMKILILLCIACYTYARLPDMKKTTDLGLTVDLPVQTCVRGTHLDDSLCVLNTKHCDNYDATTKNCIDCNWYSFWTSYDDRPWQGSYCATHWWLFALWMLGLLLLAGLLIGICCMMCKAPKTKAQAPVEYHSPSKHQEVHVQRQPVVHYQQRPQQEVHVQREPVVHYQQRPQQEVIYEQRPVQTVYTSQQPQYVYREPVEMSRVEAPRQQQNVSYTHGEPRTVYGNQSNVNYGGETRYVDDRVTYSPERTNMLYSNAQQGHNPYNPYN